MLSFYNIYSIALYEIKNLLRSWFFRIFSLLALIILVLINTGLFGSQRAPNMFRALPSLIPYLNILLLNVVQAIIGGFMASDFLKYDSKLDTTDVIYMRSMTNADYVLGKTLGVCFVFGVLNIFALIVAFVFNVFITDTAFLPVVYVLYPLLISLPTLLFIFGLSFMLMAVIRNQALTFIFLLGYIASTMFFLGNRFHYIFDYMAFNVPFTYSDFSGFGGITAILIHRGIYFLLGVGFVFITVLLLRRLPQSRIMNRISLALALCSIAGAVILGNIYLSGLSAGKELRAEISALNKKEANTPAVSLKTCNIDLTHNGSLIDVQTDLVFTNSTSAGIDRYIFSLNPGLDIQKIVRDGSEITFSRELHILTVKPSTALAPGTKDSLTIYYSGAINEDACYPEIDETVRESNFRLIFYNIGKRYSFLTPDYVLLTPENLWYPVAGIPYGSAYPQLQAKDFVDFTLQVKTGDALTAVSQGAVTRGGDGVFIFRPEVPLPQLSLAIGRYEKRSMTVEEVDYNLFILEGHDYFSEYFTDLNEKLPELISDIKMRYEDRLGIGYPYKRFSLIETPVQFFTYPRLWTLVQETVQPEQVYLPEKGMLLLNADFRQRSYWIGRMSQRGQRAMTPEEIQTSIFRSFVNQTFINSSSPFFSMRRAIRFRPGQSSITSRLNLNLIPNYNANFSVFPLYYSHCHHFYSGKWPIFTTVLELFLNERVENRPPSFIRSFTGLTNEERANLELASRDLFEILDEHENIEDAHDVLKLKSSFLFALIQSAAGTEEFREFLDDMLSRHRFAESDVEDFVSELNERFAFDIQPHFDSLLHARQLPAFILSDPEAVEIIENERTRYQVTFTVSNPEAVDGIISVNFRTRGGGSGERRRMFSQGMSAPDTEYQRFISIQGGETKEIGVVLDDRPGAMTVDTFISLNIPSVIEKNMGRIELDENTEPFDGERITDRPVTSVEPGEIIVDNEDSGFEIQSVTTDSFVKQLLNKNNIEEEDYIGLRFWNLPRRWRTTTNSSFYGTYRRSAYIIRAGKGENKVVWNAGIPMSGQYSVYCYVPQIQQPRMRRRRDGGERQDSVQDFHFTIRHDDGAEKIEFDASGAQEGWNFLGTYYFSEGQASIELTDESDGRMVYADAVKFTLKE